jgi:hypothetical protein
MKKDILETILQTVLGLVAFFMWIILAYACNG